MAFFIETTVKISNLTCFREFTFQLPWHHLTENSNRLILPVNIAHACETLCMTEINKIMYTLNRNILRMVYAPVTEKGLWTVPTDEELGELKPIYKR
jgi:hypothetical protein